MSALFDVYNVKEEERYDYWHELIFRYFCRVESQQLSDKFIDASLIWNQLGCLGLSEIRCEAVRYERSSGALQSAPNEDFLVSLMLEGEANMSQAGRHTRQKPGDIVFYDSARGFVYEFTKAYHAIVLRIPRRSLLSRFPGAENLTAVAMSSEADMGALVRSMMLSAASVDVPKDSSAASRVGASIVDVLSAALETQMAGLDVMDDRHASLLQRAKNYIRANIDDPDLNVEAVANAVAVSPRTLNRLFASEGTPVMRWLWKERLEQSRSILSEGRATQVTEVALNLGFKSVSHFSRTFKDTYGVTPNMILRARSH
ncbi:AraC-like ligand-binding domain-containing protein [Marinobacterium lutimaris]|uniref:AraC-type DNA-binding protein n=1 Tax=Marinobacterium lutimaris TaxID=568106 RepID=A0A1H5UZW1_9GAMM|nr:helix-turn-helix domain-containing protein [Marinobacterium lutimaris]SEF80506.1 AraC-type DNA-binding protein [Marinobacterium lutimaris]